jgi:hypothetical protein
MPDDAQLEAGDRGEVAQLSLLGGGLLRTWTAEGAQLWTVADPDGLRALLARGVVARTEQMVDRFREVGTLFADKGLLLLQPRFPQSVEDTSLTFEATSFQLRPADGPSGEVDGDELQTLVATAVEGALQRGEYVVLERGGWDAPAEPYCLWIALSEEDGPVSVVETAPPPARSELWAEHIREGVAGVSLRAPLTPEAFPAVPVFMVEAIRGWGEQPWDIALTFGRPPQGELA